MAREILWRVLVLIARIVHVDPYQPAGVDFGDFDLDLRTARYCDEQRFRDPTFCPGEWRKQRAGFVYCGLILDDNPACRP